MELAIPIDHEQIRAFCERHYITKMAFFGSVLTDEFDDNSDVDVLVYFHPDHVPGMIRLCGMERELADIFGRRADMRTPNDLSRAFRDEIIQSARTAYAA